MPLSILRCRCALRRQARAAAWLGASLLALSPVPAAAGGPEGGVVVRGAARIVASARETAVRQTSRRAVIDWRRFDVDQGHAVVFDQPGRRAATLNRVTGGGASVIAGSIRAPGTVVIENEAGVLFTPTGRVEAGGLVATSQAADAARFQESGTLALQGGGRAARVVNQGRITVGEAGLAALVGRDVENAGAIVAERGTVALAGGTRATLDLSGDGMVRIAVQGDAGVVANPGRIVAGRVLLTAGEAARTLDGAINTSGVIRAGSSAGRGGRIELVGRGGAGVRVSGTLDASGRARGGAIDVTGRAVTIATGADIAARGAEGGEIRIGGGRSGRGELRRAERLTVERGASIAADGAAGRGGSVVAWSDGATWIDGRISAEGGGFVETSGRDALGLGPNASVAVGEGGAWLLDPRDVVIGDAVGTVGGVVAPPPGSGAWTVSRVALEAALDAGADVTVTTAQPASSGNGDIRIARPLAWTGGGTLRLQADRDIAINAAVTTGGGLVATAARDIDVRADVTGTGAAPVTLVATGGSLRTSRATAGDLAITTETGALALRAPAGDVMIRRFGGGGILVASETGALDIAAGRQVLIRGEASPGQWVRVGTADSASDVTVTAPRVDLLAGRGEGSFAELVTGADGSLTVAAARFELRDWPDGARARVAALGGAALTLEADRQRWDATVEAGSGLNDGGDVRIAGEITALVRPTFSLASGADFVLAATAPGGAASSYRTQLPLAIATAGTGTVAIEAPIEAHRVALISQERVRLGPEARIAAGAPVDAVVIAAGRAFENAAGADVLDVPRHLARWLLYVDGFDGVTGPLPGPREFDLYGRSFTLNPPVTIVPQGNRVIWGERPTLTLGAETLSKTYGAAASAGFTVGGLRPGDSLATALASGPQVTSAGFAADAPAGSYATRVTATPSAQGYLVEVVNGRLTVDPAPLTVAARDASRRYGAADPAFAADISGLVAGDSAAALGGTLGFATADPASPVGGYALTPSGLTSRNYAIAFVPGTLTITPAPLTVTANDASRRYGAADPGFTARYDGLVLGDSADDLDGALAFAATSARDSDVGNYAVTAQGLTSRNYDISFRPGRLAITPAPLTVAAEDASREVGASDPAFSVRYSGFVLDDAPGDLDGMLTIRTTATAQSPTGRYRVTPDGLASPNYAISYASAWLDVAPPAPPPVNPVPTARQAERIAGFQRGVQPLTPGDASFRTTVAEAPPALANPFGLSYSLGEVIQLTGGPDATQGFVPAAGGGTQGFVPAAGGIEVAQADVPTAGCSGLVGIGDAAACGRRTVSESYWSSRAGALE
jgi:filamentous hemagglutinin family protein